MIAQLGIGDDQCGQAGDGVKGLQGIMNNTIRIVRLKLLFIAAKVVTDSNVDKVKYSIHDAKLTQVYLEIFIEKRRKLRIYSIGQIIDSSIDGCDFRERFNDYERAVAVNLDERFVGWKLGITQSMEFNPAEEWELLDDVIVH